MLSAVKQSLPAVRAITRTQAATVSVLSARVCFYQLINIWF